MTSILLRGVMLLSLVLPAVISSMSSTSSFGGLNYTSDLLRLAKAAHIKAYLNEEKLPCENFYKFACGNWHRMHPASIYRRKTVYLEQLEQLYLRKSADMLAHLTPKDTRADIALKSFYASCRNETSDNDMSAAIVEALGSLVELKGNWPTVSVRPNYEYDEYDWLRVVAELKRRLGMDILIGLDVVRNDEPGMRMYRIRIGAPALELGTRAAYLSSEHAEQRARYKYRITQKLASIYPAKSAVWADELAQQVLDIEQQLARGFPENYNAANTLSNDTRLRYAVELRADYGNWVDLNRYLSLVFNDTVLVPVYEMPPGYMTNLVQLIRTTPKLTIANYTMWRVVEALSSARRPRHERADTWCVEKLNEFMPQQLESLFHRNYNSMQLINEVQSTWADVKRVFRDSLQSSRQHLRWLTSSTRAKAIGKLDALELHFRTPNDGQSVEQMRSVQLRRENYYKNIIELLQWQTRMRLDRWNEVPVETRVSESKTDTPDLPKYVPAQHKVVIPVTFLQTRIFWDPTYPQALKYSSIGFLLAHEMLRGFDMSGGGSAKHWWDELSGREFINRTKCYEKYKHSSVEDPAYLRTSIADSGALGIAYQAYQRWWRNIAENENEVDSQETLPLLDYTRNQLFFIGYAQLWCADYPESVETYRKQPEFLRVNNAIENSDGFVEDYKCEAGSKLNTPNKCKIF